MDTSDHFKTELTFLEMVTGNRTDTEEQMLSIVLRNQLCRVLMHTKDCTLEEAIQMADGLFEDIFQNHHQHVHDAILPIFERILNDIVQNQKFSRYNFSAEKLKENYRLVELVLMYIGFECMQSALEVRRTYG